MINTKRLRVSVIIPTYQRREIVIASIRSLEMQDFDELFEVVVVVDGSRDGSAGALRALSMPFALTVLEQPNSGAASARNLGASVAKGELFLFLDDDMQADRRLLSEHDMSHQRGADIVFGHIPLHPDSPSNVITAAVKSWAVDRAARLSAPGVPIELFDFLTGQMSVSREVFHAIGGFDANFTKDGSFGNEDVDFGHRVLSNGYSAAFNASAISYQKYVVTPDRHLQQWRQAGRADVMFSRKHPESAMTVFEQTVGSTRFGWRVARPLARVPAWEVWTKPLRWFSLMLAKSRFQGHITATIFFSMRAIEYWRGVWDAGDIPKCRKLRVLAYHSISDQPDGEFSRVYCLPKRVFQRQILTLLRLGFIFIHPDEVVNYLQGQSLLPRRACVLTFDDCYRDLLDILPFLRANSISAIAFAVSGAVGAKAFWNKPMSAQLPLLSVRELMELQASEVEIGAHSRSHQQLNLLDIHEAHEEIVGSIVDIKNRGLKSPRFFAYPYGEYSQQIQDIIRTAGIIAAFSINPGIVNRESDPTAISRIEIRRADIGMRLAAKVLFPRSFQWAYEEKRRINRIITRAGSSRCGQRPSPA